MLIPLAVAALVVLRNLRPQKMTVSRFWIFPILMVALSGFVLWTSVVASPHAPWLGVVAGVIGVALGIPFGIARGHHSRIRLADHGTFYVDPSIIVMLIWLAAFAVRYAIRAFLPEAGSLTLAVSDGALLFAIASLVVARLMIFRKYEALLAAAPLAHT